MPRSILIAIVALVLQALPASADDDRQAPADKAQAGSAPCTIRTFETSTFTVCEFDSKSQTLQLALSDTNGKALRGFVNLAAQLGSQANTVEFAMNAGMFDTAGAPIGLYVENGVVRHGLNTEDGNGNFYLKPNGVFSLDADGNVLVETAESYSARQATPIWATQSGPMLLINGALNPQIALDGPSKNIRNAVGVRDAHTALFVISNEPVSFGRLGRFFRDTLDCQDALYLDGTVSSLWVPLQGRQDHAAKLGPMVLVLKKS
jgi:uncharacterized protein YigE (DUF2233 family)